MLFHGEIAPGDGSPWLTVAYLAWFSPVGWGEGALVIVLDIVRAPPDGHATVALNPTTHRVGPATIASLGQKTHVLREPGGCWASLPSQRYLFLILIPIQLTSLSPGGFLNHLLQDGMAGVGESEFIE